MERIEVNLMRCTGPAFDGVDHRLLALELVARRVTAATMFRSDGEVVDAGELIYRRPLLIVLTCPHDRRNLRDWISSPTLKPWSVISAGLRGRSSSTSCSAEIDVRALCMSSIIVFVTGRKLPRSG